MPEPRDLTPNQRLAVEHFEGPLLVLAGPGSGKTRVITRRIARLIERKVHERQILAITFTNKAAAEMAERVAALLPGSRVWVSTFHRFCARLLRRHARIAGLEPNFTILDTGDQRQLIREALSDLDFDPVHYPPAAMAERISRAKNQLLTPEQFSRRYQESIGDYQQAVTARLYPEYQKRLLESNAVDFDDLLMHVALMLDEHPELRSDLDERHRFVLVDEYQDTNSAQYRIVAALSQDYPNVCVTGDPDQSIYGWRGAEIDNILRFEADYPQARVIRLEQNFRSTRQILQTADALIAHNRYRKSKVLTTDNPDGEPVELLCFADAREEAAGVARGIRAQVDAGGRTWSDFAVFYRVNTLSRELELALTRHRVPYHVTAGVAFYQRAEVKDLLAYLRLIHNPADRTAFLRVVNTPLRGIGKKTVAVLSEWAAAEGLNLVEAAARAESVAELKKRPALQLRAFSRLMDEFSLSAAGSVERLLQTVLDRTGYARGWIDSQSEQDRERLAVVRELLDSARQYDQQAGGEPTLEGFLETASLAGDTDDLDVSAGRVTLMTLHAAKGLEFPVVYIVGVEQNLIPHERVLKLNNDRELEEERRLLFVGMTRAEQQLFLTLTRQRELRGRLVHSIPSMFLSETELIRRDHWQSAVEPGEESQVPPDEQEIRGPGTGDRGPGTAVPEPGLPLRGPDEANAADAEGSRNTGGEPRRPLLMTGADLLNGRLQPADVPQGFAVGMKVRHPRYGLGTIVGVSGFARRRTLTVEFENGPSNQTFIADKCPLQPVGVR